MPGVEGVRGTFTRLEIPLKRPTYPLLILTAKDLSREDFERLSMEGIQQLVQKGDIDREDNLIVNEEDEAWIS